MRRVHPFAPLAPLAILAALAAVTWLGCTHEPAGDPLGDDAAHLQVGSSSTQPGRQLSETCGGVAALRCDDGLVCQHADGTCGAADDSGTCVVRPTFCMDYFWPVCGCDGTTYGNRCDAAMVGATIAYAGSCGAATE